MHGRSAVCEVLRKLVWSRCRRKCSVADVVTLVSTGVNDVVLLDETAAKRNVLMGNGGGFVPFKKWLQYWIIPRLLRVRRRLLKS